MDFPPNVIERRRSLSDRQTDERGVARLHTDLGRERTSQQQVVVLVNLRSEMLIHIVELFP